MVRVIGGSTRAPALCLCLAVLAANAVTADSRFDPADITRPDFFPILPWGTYHAMKRKNATIPDKGLDGIAACGFNMAGFVLPSDLPRCETVGLAAILMPTGIRTASDRRRWKDLTDQEIDERVQHMIEAGGGSPAVAGYFLMDEPSVVDFPALGKAVAAVKRHAPGKLAYINLFPNYATLGALDGSKLGTVGYTEYLERFIAEVSPQFLSYDNYMVVCSDDLRNETRAAKYFHNLLEVRRVAQQHRLLFLNVVAACQIRPTSPIPSPANLQLQAFTTLAAGYRGVGWYTYFATGYGYAPIDPSGAKTLTWGYLRQVNAQIASLAPVMSRLASTGVFFSRLFPANGQPLLPGRLIENINCATPVMVGEFRHASGDDYVMVVNLSLERSARLTLETTRPRDTIRIVSAVDGTLSAFDPVQGFWLTAGQGALLKLGSQPDPAQ